MGPILAFLEALYAAPPCSVDCPALIGVIVPVVLCRRESILLSIGVGGTAADIDGTFRLCPTGADDCAAAGGISVIGL